jgi:acyl carrier protein
MRERIILNPMEKIAAVIRDYIAQNILFSAKGYPYADEASFLDEGIVDSMNVLELVTFVEERFGVKVDQQDIVPDNFDSVRTLADYIRRKRPDTA